VSRTVTDPAAGDATATHAARLARLWASRFGDEYTERNAAAGPGAGAWHHALCRRLKVRSVLEVGCNLGLNLTRIGADPRIAAFGVDVSEHALARGRQRLPRVHLAKATVYRLPFADATFDLALTCGVLIHVPPGALPGAMGELARVTRRFVWIGEYASREVVEVPYRGLAGALFKCDFGRVFSQVCPGARRIEEGFLDKARTGFDDLTWWLFEVPGR